MLGEVISVDKPRSIVWIPGLYAVIILVVNVLAVVVYDRIDIADPDLRMIRLGSITNLMFYGSLFVLYIVLFVPAWRRTIEHFRTHKARMIQMAALGIAGMFAATFLLGSLYLWLGIDNDPVNQQILEMQLSGPFFDRASLAIFAVLFAPLVEEMVFRLATFRLLVRIPGMPVAGTIAISSLLFGLIHVLSDDLVQILYYAGLGVILGLVYHKSKNILVPIAVHLVFNLFVVITMFAGV